MKKTSTRLADGREIIYYDLRDDAVRDAVDRRPLGGTTTASEIRYDPLLAEWTAVTAHRQERTYHPPADACPLCPTRGGHLSEIPEPGYDVAVFENRFPSFTGGPGPEAASGPPGLLTHRPGAGRCEVVCFTPDHDSSFASLTHEQARLVMDVWTDRTAELSLRPGVEQIFCFENRGAEIGVTLQHPHGQIYAYPFTTPRTARMLDSVARHAARTGGRNLFDDVVAAEAADGRRIVCESEHWTAFVPHAAHWPYEVHLYPRERVPDLPALSEEARADFPGVYLEVLRRFDRVFGPDEPPTPYIAAWHQAPFTLPARGQRTGGTGDGAAASAAREDFALHLELFTVRRTSGKLKFLAGSESGMNVFINDVPPERAAERLREVASDCQPPGVLPLSTHR
ncbi:galactose-1-phosphate uridylyltransferase [Streptomyces abyssalis]|uniref:Galactose-1-phosphate uridylyltransferase n=1 Tax=Streptomyces abyssalis TaxID=933944 RepID=A0A1E7JMU9_9ACTN|nr:galactose-1-phosphate uridylyltransferase [Streptomyces abyssalis]OEU87046.1 galactose-1-phosphate uridylyltransferase [Streptomyces abyssalis]OEU89570.1 galactose-1-phosphate uridylyltransferase [Streptomyces abyssalis]